MSRKLIKARVKKTSIDSDKYYQCPSCGFVLRGCNVIDGQKFFTGLTPFEKQDGYVCPNCCRIYSIYLWRKNMLKEI